MSDPGSTTPGFADHAIRLTVVSATLTLTLAAGIVAPPGPTISPLSCNVV